MKTPEKISIKLKFRIMLVCFAAYAIITGLSFLYLIRSFDRVETSYNKENNLKINISELRNNQYELFSLYSGKKDKEKENIITDNIAQICDNIDDGISYLNINPIGDSRKIRQSTVILKEEFALYRQKKDEITKTEDEINTMTQDGGRLATSRNTVKTTILQCALAGSMKAFEEISKAEASFLETTNIDDYKKFNKNIDAIISMAKNFQTSNILIKYQNQKLMDQLTDYKTTFNLLFSKQLMLGLSNYDGYKGEASSLVKTMLTDLEEMMVESQIIRDDIKSASVIKVLIIQGIMLAVGIPFFLILFWSVNKPINLMSEYLRKLLNGELVSAEVSEDSSNEMDLMRKQLSLFIENLREKQIFTEDIGNGKKDNGFKLLSEKDQFGNALIIMKEKLDEQQQRQLMRRKEDEIQDKINIGLAEFGNILRKNNNNIDDLCNETVRNIIHYTDANYGAIYIYDDEDPNNVHLVMKSTYAADKKKYMVKQVSLYEGIVGTCAVEKTMQIIDDIPKDYIKIGSGFGNTLPASLIVMPLLINDEVYGVLELCRTDKFEDYRIKFLEKIAEEIASTISYVKENSKNLFKLQEKGKRLDDYTKRLHKAKKDIADRDEAIKKANNDIEKLQKENSRLMEELSASRK
ncbi:MAG: GAF domain-containing protein [Bacteroidales bacterium]|nr:GAF domain-containing protein [Bacteroidales bacterium]